MRDVAPAFGMANAINSNAVSTARNILVITAPQCDVWLAFVMRTPCQAVLAVQDSEAIALFDSAGLTALRRRAAGKVLGGKFCRRVNRPLTINAQAWEQFGAGTSGWDFQPCASMDRTELRLLPRRPPRAAAPVARLPSASRRRRAIPPRPVRCVRSPPS